MIDQTQDIAATAASTQAPAVQSDSGPAPSPTGPAGNMASGLAGIARGTASDVKTDVAAAVARRPWTVVAWSIAIGAALGIAIGAWFF